MGNKKHLNAAGRGRFIYDYKYDILTFKIEDRNYKKSIEFHNFAADIDDEGFVTGIRIFDASKVLSVNKYGLKNIVNFEFKASIEKNVITITLKFVGKIRNKIIPIIGEKRNFMQQITTPVGSHYHLSDSSVDCPMEA